MATEVGTPEREKYVHMEMNNLDKVISQIDSALGEVSVQLVILMRKEDVVVDKDSCELEEICPHAEQLRSYVFNLRNILNRLMTIRDKLEI